MVIDIRQPGWVGCALAFLALFPESFRDWLFVGVLCALSLKRQDAKNSVGSCGKVMLV
jgi:hypothetical protein